jgi:hypothetical protein
MLGMSLQCYISGEGNARAFATDLHGLNFCFNLLTLEFNIGIEVSNTFSSAGGSCRTGVSGPTRANPVHLFPIAKFTALGWLAFTVTDFSQVFGSVKTGRCTVRSVRTS